MTVTNGVPLASSGVTVPVSPLTPNSKTSGNSKQANLKHLDSIDEETSPGANVTGSSKKNKMTSSSSLGPSGGSQKKSVISRLKEFKEKRSFSKESNHSNHSKSNSITTSSATAENGRPASQPSHTSHTGNEHWHRGNRKHSLHAYVSGGTNDDGFEETVVEDDAAFDSDSDDLHDHIQMRTFSNSGLLVSTSGNRMNSALIPNKFIDEDGDEQEVREEIIKDNPLDDLQEDPGDCVAGSGSDHSANSKDGLLCANSSPSEKPKSNNRSSKHNKKNSQQKNKSHPMNFSPAKL